MIITELEDGSVEVDGIDGILLRVLAQQMNFNVQLHLTSQSSGNDAMWGDIYENGTATGKIKFILVSHAMRIIYFRCNKNGHG
jgi:hypothetical protein